MVEEESWELKFSSQQHDEVKMHQAETQKLRGPDGYGVAKGWRLPGKVGVSSDVSVT